jgi:hypothetical protein
MIISASRRTDIPAYYHKWLANRLLRGWCESANPFNPRQISRIDLTPAAVGAFVFWSRDVRNFGNCMDILDDMGYKYYFNLTYNNFPEYLEPNAISPGRAASEFENLAGRIGPGRIVWRYDPVIFSDEINIAWHTDNFSRLAGMLAGTTRRVITSVMTPYQKTLRRLADIENIEANPQESKIREMISNMSEIASENNMELRICCYPGDMSDAGASPAKCIDDEIPRNIFGINIEYKKDKSQRPGCHCAQSRDIGAYDTCLRGCRYCYAVRSLRRAAENYRRHDPKCPRLIPV